MDNLEPCPFCGRETEPLKVIDFENRAYIICSDHNCWGCMQTRWGTADDKAKFVKMLRDRWNRRPDKWISVTEKLPREREKVLVLTDASDIQLGYVGEIISAWFRCESLEMPVVTHWMPLPEPPEGGKS